MAQPKDSEQLREAANMASAIEMAVDRLVSGYPDPSAAESDDLQTLVSAIAMLRKRLDRRRFGDVANGEAKKLPPEQLR
jgi:hypothetical protein